MVEALLDQGPVLPMRFGCTLAGRDELISLLRSRQPEFTDNLDRVRDAVEVAEPRRPTAIGERFGDHRILRIPAVHVEPRELRRLAQVFASAPAEPTLPAHPSEPCHANPIPFGDQRHSGADRIHSAHHLMSRHDRKPHGLQFALHDMQISPADAAGLHPYPHLPDAGLRHRPLLQ